MTATIGVWRRLPIPYALLNDLINIEKPSQTADGQGGFNSTWSTIATNIHAIVQDTAPPAAWLGGELMSLGAQGEHVTHRIYIRFGVTGLDSSCMVVFGTRRFRVHDVGNFGGNTMIQAEEVRQ